MLHLIVELCQEQFRIPFPHSLLAAYYSIRAAIAWVPEQHDERKVQRYLEKFYRIARRYSQLPFSPAKVAGLELRYFEVHRRLAGAADKSEFVETLVHLHSALFDLTPEQVRESARLRVLAADTVDRITSGQSTNSEEDWRQLEEYLRQCYRSIHQALSQ
jgi:hypothetical protein